jgi:hypothetical protein
MGYSRYYGSDDPGCGCLLLIILLIIIGIDRGCVEYTNSNLNDSVKEIKSKVGHDRSDSRFIGWRR